MRSASCVTYWLSISSVAVYTSAFLPPTPTVVRHEKDFSRPFTASHSEKTVLREHRRQYCGNRRRRRASPRLGTGADDNGISSTEQDVNLPELISLFGGSPTNLLRLDTENGIRGVYTNEPMKKGTILLKMPLSSCIRDDQPPAWLLEYQEQQQEDEEDNSDSAVWIQDWVTRLAACILEKRHEQENKEASDSIDQAMQAWLKLLPSRSTFQHCLPIHWPDSIQSKIDYMPLELAVDSAYFARAAPLGDLLGAIPETYGCNDGKIKENVEWALDLVHTRCCRCASRDTRNASDSEKALRVLVPVFDMINHSPEPNAEFFRKDDYMMVQTLSDIAADEQVCIHYGGSTAPAWKRLFSYGFCDTSDNDDDGFAVYEEDAVEIVLEDRFRFEISPTQIPVELIQYQAQRTATDDGEDESLEVELSPEIGYAIIDQLKMAANESKKKRDDATNAATNIAEESASIPLGLIADLHESHRRTLLTCAGGLQEYLEEE
eukprot:jgi/Psemu1/197106/e_gw1.198.36.1